MEPLAKYFHLTLITANHKVFSFFLFGFDMMIFCTPQYVPHRIGFKKFEVSSLVNILLFSYKLSLDMQKK